MKTKSIAFSFSSSALELPEDETHDDDEPCDTEHPITPVHECLPVLRGNLAFKR
jgi:hypothetical protein